MTIIDGLTKLTSLASTPPTRRPPSRISWMQVTSPSAAPSATSCAVTAPLAASRSASAGEAPDAGRGQRVAGQRGAAEQRLQAADVAAGADRPVRVDLDVADVAGAAVGAPVDLAVEVDAAADAGADLDEQEVVDRVGHAAVPLADRHDVHVVVDHRPGSRARGPSSSRTG